MKSDKEKSYVTKKTSHMKCSNTILNDHEDRVLHLENHYRQQTFHLLPRDRFSNDVLRFQNQSK